MIPCDDGRKRRLWPNFLLTRICLLATFCTVTREERALGELFIFNELCALKEDPGSCRALRDRYFFDVDTGRCEHFEYGGCGGNENNFETLEACREMCVVSADKNPCHLPRAEGPCRGLLTRYFFDDQSQQCKRFYYGGCFGNANNFNSMSDCEAKCHQKEKSVTPTPISDQGLVNSTMGQTKSPILVQPTVVKQVDMCFKPVERGTCDGNLRRFAYNATSGRCHEFSYSGCGGNDNNFNHRRLCFKKCIRNRNDGGTKMIRIRKKNIPKILVGSV
ncbi:carboxypeptidase inhibitor SmCI-like [Stigmatopora nigra]